MLRHIGIACLAAVITLISAPAIAQTLCGDRAEISKKLHAKFEEAPRSLGVTHDGRMLELFVSPSGGWTITITFPVAADDSAMTSCLVAHGEGWQHIPEDITTVRGETS